MNCVQLIISRSQLVEILYLVPYFDKYINFFRIIMSEWVNIAADETEEPVEVPAESDGNWIVLFLFLSVSWFTFL